MSKPQEVWELYKSLLISRRFDEWGDLWADDGQFTVVYGKKRFGEETYTGRKKIVSFFSGARDKIETTYFENDVVHKIENSDSFFAAFDFNAITTGKYHYKNRIVCQFTIDGQGKIRELIEYADPIARQAFLDRLSTINSLSDAVERNDLITAERLLKEGLDVNQKNASGFTPLMIASGLGNPQMVELMLTAGADTTMVDTRMGATALHKAAQRGVVEVAKLLVQKGAFIDAQAPTLGNTPLIDAVWHKNLAMVRYLLDQGARLEVRNRSGRTARNFAEADRDLASDRLNNPKHDSPARDSAEADRVLAVQILELLEDRQARDGDMNNSQRLMGAVLQKDLAEVQKLIAARTSLDEKSPLINENKHAGYTPLLFACLQEGCGGIVKALLEAGANPRIVDDLIKATPGHKAGYQGRTDAARELVKDGRFEIDAQGPYNGYTALHDAIWHGHTETVKVFLEADARLDLKTHTGHTPLELAKLYKYPEIEKLIQEKMNTMAK